MNGIVRLKHIVDYKKVRYYSVVLDQDDEPIDTAKSLFDIFIEQQTLENQGKLNHILAWLEEIGIKYGAQENLFRPEQRDGEALGLPPKNFTKPPFYIEDGDTIPNNLRLYCHRLNSNVVILFNGAIKTEKNAQECPNVKEHFIQANNLTNILDIAIKDQDIRWIDDFTDIDYDDDLVLNY